MKNAEKSTGVTIRIGREIRCIFSESTILNPEAMNPGLESIVKQTKFRNLEIMIIHTIIVFQIG